MKTTQAPEIKEEKAIVIFDEKKLEAQKNLGMKNVDPEDIRPPRILLKQKSSEEGTFLNTEGLEAKTGQFFHTAKFDIYDTFDCYCLKATAGTYTDKEHADWGIMKKYTAIFALVPTLELFEMVFKSTAKNTLSSLFTASVAQKRPMFSFKLKFEQKKLKNAQGQEWFIPVLRIAGQEEDQAILKELSSYAERLDANEAIEEEEPPTPEVPR